jgi:hypothetical protein
MSKKVLIQQIQPDPPSGPVFGQIAQPSDVMGAQIYAHQHVEELTKDFIVGDCGSPVCHGFNWTLTGGLGITIGGGHLADAIGKWYGLDDLANVPLVLSPADPTNLRIDLIVGTLAIDNPSVPEAISFMQLLTQSQLNSGVVPYPPQQFTQPTELHTILTVSVLQGVASATPTPPTLGANQVLLYTITVPPGATALGPANVGDNRPLLPSLCVLYDKLLALMAEVAAGNVGIQLPIPLVETTVGPGAGFLSGLTGQDVANYVANLNPGGDPLARAQIMTSDFTCDAVANQDTGGVPVVDMPPAVQVMFATLARTVNLNSIPAALNPRLVDKALTGSPGQSVTLPTALSLAALLNVSSEGGGNWSQLSSPTLPASTVIYNRRSAARDNRYLEMFGAGATSSTAWWTFDTVSNTITVRAFTGTVPTNPIVFACPLGSGNILLAAAASGAAATWYSLNASSGACTVLANQPTFTGTLASFYGDLIQSGIIFVASLGASTWQFEIYNAGAGTWESITPNVTVPYPSGSWGASCCIYQNGQALFSTNYGGTYLFNYSTLLFTQISSMPSGISANFDLLNINGASYLLFAGAPTGSGTGSVGYEVTPGTSPTVQQLSFALPFFGRAGAASLLNASGLPMGQGFAYGGQSPGGGVYVQGYDNEGTLQPLYNTNIWQFVPTGIIQTVYNGQTAITLGAGVAQATFQLPPYSLPWQAATVVATLAGSVPPGSVSIQESFNGGVSWQTVTPDAITSITGANTPSIRAIQITLYSQGSTAPILTGITEVFAQTGGPGLTELVLRFNVPPGGTYGLYINGNGTVSYTTTLVPTTNAANSPAGSGGNCLLLTMLNNGTSVNPTVQTFINKRYVREKLTGTKGSGNPSIVNNLPFAPDFVEAYGITGGATGAMYKIADPTVTFNTNIVVTGLASSSDGYLLEISG